jgi:hypothetical protein
VKQDDGLFVWLALWVDGEGSREARDVHFVSFSL